MDPIIELDYQVNEGDGSSVEHSSNYESSHLTTLREQQPKDEYETSELSKDDFSPEKFTSKEQTPEQSTCKKTIPDFSPGVSPIGIPKRMEHHQNMVNNMLSPDNQTDLVAKSGLTSPLDRGRLQNTS